MNSLEIRRKKLSHKETGTQSRQRVRSQDVCVRHHRRQGGKVFLEGSSDQQY